jgi:serine protease inhibitor
MKPDLYLDSHGFAMLEMPYKGEQLSMVVIVPQSADGLADLEKKLSSDQLQTWIDRLQRRAVNVFLPKFKLETTYKMADTLKAMGMARAFADPRDPANGAQFDGMNASQDPEQKLYISKVIHKAFVEVSEKGTEAAAATAVRVGPRAMSVGRSLSFTPTFHADKPFLFVIRDKPTGTILFVGRVTDPRG